MGLKSMRILCFLGVCSVLSPGMQGQKKGLATVTEWRQLDYAYANDAERQNAIRSGEFVPGNGLLIDSDVSYQNGQRKIFATVPRFVDGIPGTLNTVLDVSNNGNPLLQPYPSWEWHRDSARCNRDRLVSVFRTQIDECGRLWVLDTGKIGENQLCKPQVIAFDPNTDQVLHRYEIPLDQIYQRSILVTPAVDVRNPQQGCSDVFIYIADVTEFGLIVYDVRNNRSWRITNKLFYPIPEYGTFTIAGESFDLMDGILGLALSPYDPYKDRILYFHALASNTENYVHTSVIRNSSIFQDHDEAVPRAFKVFTTKRHSQSAAEAMDKNGILYFGAMKEIEMKCWNSHTDYDRRNFDTVDNNRNNLQFASGVKIVNNPNGKQELWVVTNRIQKSYTGTMTDQEVNFRILAATTDDLTKGTKCQNRRGGGNSGGGSYGGGYGLITPSRPQSSWGGVFSDNKTPSYANRNKVSQSIDAKREVQEDRLIFN